MKKVLMAFAFFAIAMIKIPKVTIMPHIYIFIFPIADKSSLNLIRELLYSEYGFISNTDVVCTWTDCTLTASSTSA